jgi:hypothetical protein
LNHFSLVQLIGGKPLLINFYVQRVASRIFSPRSSFMTFMSFMPFMSAFGHSCFGLCFWRSCFAGRARGVVQSRAGS